MSEMPSSRRRPGRDQDAPPATLAVLLLYLAATAGCGREAPSADEPVDAGNDGVVTSAESGSTAPSAAEAAPPPLRDCVGTVSEYCAFLGGQCPTYKESVERRRSLCAHWIVTTSACGHRYRSVAWREPLLGGGEEYFDPGGRLIAAHLYADYAAYCNGRSFDETFGTVLTCATRPLTKNECQRPTPR